MENMMYCSELTVIKKNSTGLSLKLRILKKCIDKYNFRENFMWKIGSRGWFFPGKLTSDSASASTHKISGLCSDSASASASSPWIQIMVITWASRLHWFCRVHEVRLLCSLLVGIESSRLLLLQSQQLDRWWQEVADLSERGVSTARKMVERKRWNLFDRLGRRKSPASFFPAFQCAV